MMDCGLRDGAAWFDGSERLVALSLSLLSSLLFSMDVERWTEGLARAWVSGIWP